MMHLFPTKVQPSLGNEAIRVIAAGSHTVSTLAGNGKRGFADGIATSAEFNTPVGIAVDASGNVYVADTGNDRIRMIAAGSRTVSTLAGGTAGFADGAPSTAESLRHYGAYDMKPRFHPVYH